MNRIFGAMLVLLITSITATAIPPMPSKPALIEKLRIISCARDFSPKKPLTQQEVFGTICESCHYHMLPPDYKIIEGTPSGAKNKSDEYFSRSEAIRLSKEIFGVKLTYWSIEDGYNRFTDSAIAWRNNSSYKTVTTITAQEPRRLAPTMLQIDFKIKYVANWGSGPTNYRTGFARLRKMGGHWAVIEVATRR